MPNEQGMSKRQILREKRLRQERRSRMITIGAITVGVALVLFVVIWPMIKPQPPVKPIDSARVRFEVNDNMMGNADAPVTVTEYSDFQCPFCQRFWQTTEEQLIQTYVETGKVLFIYRSNGEFIGPDSVTAAEAAYCAGDQGMFWDMHDLIFNNQGVERTGWANDRYMAEIAATLNLNMDDYNACMSDGKYASRVSQDAKDGLALGVQSTPTFIISYVVNGQTKTRTIQGAQDLSQFQAEIEAALQEMGL